MDGGSWHCTEGRDQDHSQGKEMQKGKIAVWGGPGKGKKERFTHLNAESQTTARRDKQAFLSDQYKETEETNRMGKIRDLFKTIRDTKETFLAKMGTIKDRNVMNLTEVGDIKKRWWEYTKEVYKKDLHDPDNHNGMNTQSQTSWNAKSSGP